MAAHANEEYLGMQKRNWSYQSLRASNVPSCNRWVANGMIYLKHGVESTMITHDETTLDLGAHPHMKMKDQYQTLATGFIT